MERTEARNLAEILRDEMYMRGRITDILSDGPKTISEIAEKLGYPADEVLKWVMGMRRYGLIIEMPKARADDYYQYKLRDQEEKC
jgi:predicted Rossmann fold nucleotide-binding protein DprA/Smf involved in DNA uptake